MEQKQTKEKPFPLDGINVEETAEQELKANAVLKAERQIEVMAELDKIIEPMEVLLYSLDGQKWNYRNKAWREMVTRMDEEGKEALKKFIKENK